MIFKPLPALTIQEATELQLLRVCWNRGKYLPAFRDAASRLISLMQQHSTLRLLLELNDLPDVPVYDQLWLSTTLLPQLVKLTVHQVVIILAEQRVYNRHVLESFLAQYQNQIRCDVQFFAQAEPALDWLTTNSPRIPGLLAEWEHAQPVAAKHKSYPGTDYQG